MIARAGLLAVLSAALPLALPACVGRERSTTPGSGATSAETGAAPENAPRTATDSGAPPVSEAPTHRPASDCDAGLAPPRAVSLDAPFPFKCRESVQVAHTDVTLTMDSVDYSPIQRVQGVEVFPWSTFSMSVSCDGHARRVAIQESAPPQRVCGYELRLVTLSGEDDASFLLTKTDGG